MMFFQIVAAIWVLMGTLASSIGAWLVLVAFITGDPTWLTTLVFGLSAMFAGMFLSFGVHVIDKVVNELKGRDKQDSSSSKWAAVDSTMADILTSWNEEASRLRDIIRNTDSKGEDDEPS